MTPTFDNAYETRVEQARKTQSTDILENFAMGHAKVVVSNLFQYAKDHKLNVKIVSGDLNPECYDEAIVKLAKTILSNGNTIDALLDKAADDLCQNNDLASLLNDHESATIKLLDDRLQHFIVVGELAFRLEKNHDLVEAFLSFNQPETAKKLLHHFDALSKRGTPVCA